MRKGGKLFVIGLTAVAIAGCGSGSSGASDLDTHAAPPGPHANLNPPTKESSGLPSSPEPPKPPPTKK